MFISRIKRECVVTHSLLKSQKPGAVINIVPLRKVNNLIAINTDTFNKKEE